MGNRDSFISLWSFLKNGRPRYFLCISAIRFTITLHYFRIIYLFLILYICKFMYINIL